MGNIKAQRLVLPSAARTATTKGQTFTDRWANGLRCYLNITAASGTGGLKVQVFAVDKYSGASTAISTGGTPTTATGLYVYELGLSDATNSGNILDCVSRPLPETWYAQVTAGDGSSYTYSLTCEPLEN